MKSGKKKKAKESLADLEYYRQLKQKRKQNNRITAQELERRTFAKFAAQHGEDKARAMIFRMKQGKPNYFVDKAKKSVTEAPAGSKYGAEGKPEWFDRAVALKKANPGITFAGISRELGAGSPTIAYWLTGRESGTFPRMKRGSFPFSPSDFPNTGAQKYFDGAKPEWYKPALQMAKAGETFTAIAKKFGIRSIRTVSDWLTKGRKNAKTGKIINPDAELEPRKPRVVKVDAKLLMDFISDGYTDADIIELIADEKGPKIASQVKNMLPVLRQKQNPGTQTIDKTRTGTMRDPDITGLVK